MQVQARAGRPGAWGAGWKREPGALQWGAMKENRIGDIAMDMFTTILFREEPGAASGP